MSPEKPNDFRAEEPEEREYDDASMNENADVMHKSVGELIEEVGAVINRIEHDEDKLKSLRNEICKTLSLHSWYEAAKAILKPKLDPAKKTMPRARVMKEMINNIDIHNNREEAKEIAMELVLVTRNWLAKNK